MTRRHLAVALVLVPALVLAWAPTRAAAETSDRLNVTIPFGFVVGQTLLPAGQYQVKASDTNPSVVWLISPDRQHVANVGTQWGGSPSRGSEPKLLFKVYGDTHFLSEVRIPGEDGRMVALTRGEVQTELAHLAELKTVHQARSRS